MSISEVNSILKKLRGDAMTPARLLADLRAGGISLERDGDGLRVRGQLTDSQRQHIKTNKAELVAILGQSEQAFDFWDADEAEEMAKVLKVRLSSVEWPETQETRLEYGLALDAIDLAYLDRNLDAFKAAVKRLLDFLDTQPKQVGQTIYYEKPPGPLITAWVKTQKFKRWLPIIRDVPKEQEQLLWEDLHEYTAVIGHCEIKVLDEGVDPNREKRRTG